MILVGIGYGIFALVRTAVNMLTDQHEKVTEATIAPPVEIPVCTPEAISFHVDASPQPQGVGEPIEITVDVTNTGSLACSLDAGDIDVYLAAGDQTIWAPSDCSSSWETPLLLDAQQEWVGTLVWSGHTYVDCEVASLGEGTSGAVPGAGTFPLTVQLGDGKPVTRFLEVR